MGYAIFQVMHQADAVATHLKEAQASIQVGQIRFIERNQRLTTKQDLGKFGKMVKLVSFAPFL